MNFSSYDTPQSFSSLPVLGLSMSIAFCTAVLLLFFTSRPSLPSKTPKLLRESYPLLGAIRFFTARWDFFRDARAQSDTGNFSFYIGKHHVVGLSGEASRQVFFGSPHLGFGEGYAVLFGKAPEIEQIPKEISWGQHFNKRITTLLRREYITRGFPHLIRDTTARLDMLAGSPSGMTDPFTSVYEIVFQLTMRMVGCTEIANDPSLLKKTLKLFETIESSTTATAIIFPSLPSPALIKRTIAGGRLYLIFKKIVDEREMSGRREDDALQHLIDIGDNVKDIIGFVVGALFAGQINSGINAAYVLVYLGLNPYWMTKAREEIECVCRKYTEDKDAPLAAQLSSIPLEAWESEFETLDLCLRDSIRLQLSGSAFRRNISGEDVKVGDEIIPKGAFAAYHLAEVHHNPSIYNDPSKWDPGRYLPDRAEDKKIPGAYMGWGIGRHPCLGMRFAKLEQNIIIAAFLGKFDYEVCDQNGTQLEHLPPTDINNHSASKPSSPIYLKYSVKE